MEDRRGFKHNFENNFSWKNKGYKKLLILVYKFLFAIFLCTSLIINLYLFEPLKIFKKLLSYTYNEIIFSLSTWVYIRRFYYLVDIINLSGVYLLRF